MGELRGSAAGGRNIRARLATRQQRGASSNASTAGAPLPLAQALAADMLDIAFPVTDCRRTSKRTAATLP